MNDHIRSQILTNKKRELTPPEESPEYLQWLRSLKVGDWVEVITWKDKPYWARVEDVDRGKQKDGAIFTQEIGKQGLIPRKGMFHQTNGTCYGCGIILMKYIRPIEL